jgi:predicted RNase H-like nuclease (RuvC/YqgF family)
MGYGSAGTPPWVDEEKIDQAKKQQKIEEYMKKIQTLEEENQNLKMRIKELERELQKSKKQK